MSEITRLVARDDLEVKSPIEVANDFYTALYGAGMPPVLTDILHEAQTNVLKKEIGR